MEAPEPAELAEVVRTGGRSLATVRRFDATVDTWFEPLRRHHTANRVFYLASEIADYSIGWHLASAGRALVDPRRERAAVRLAVALGVESALVNGFLKRLTGRTRPVLLEAAPFVVRRPRTSSFPSGHASSATMAAALLSEGSRLKPLWWAAAGTVAASRIHNRMHHASDVVAGIAAGAALAAVVRVVSPLPPR